VIYLAFFFTSFIICVALVPFIRRLSSGVGMSGPPRADRWQHRPVSRLGGIAIFTAFIAGLGILFTLEDGNLDIKWPLLVCCSLMFLVGLYDDFHPLSPHAKFIAQILVAALAIGFGYTTDFFTPRIEDEIAAQLPNILLTFLWLVGITNAFNLLDNMDGLAAGIALIAAGILSYFFLSSGDIALLAVSLCLAGAVAGFLIYNFPPASIFMGDSGSLFLGFTLAILAITRQPQASNVLAVMGVPILLFLLPILDTVLVTFTRLLRGQSPIRGGRDHTSHRLIAFGLSERQTVFALYGIALVCGITAASLEAIQYWYSLVLAPFLVISLAVLFAYLGGLRVLQPESEDPKRTRITRIMIDLAFRKRLLEVALDFILISLAFYLAVLVANGLRMNEILLNRYLASLPVILIAAYISFFSLGIYRSVWRYIGLSDLFRFFGASVGCGIFAAGIFFILDAVQLEIWDPSSSPSALVLALFSVFLFLGLAASRSSFRIIEALMPKKIATEEVPVLIYGAGEDGIMLVDWLRIHSQFPFKPVGFIDDNPLLSGRWIHGLKVVGGLSQLENILTQKRIAGIILLETDNLPDLEELAMRCQSFNCWVRKAVLGFDTVNFSSPQE